jgi:hypothetical protein
LTGPFQGFIVQSTLSGRRVQILGEKSNCRDHR